MLNTQRDTNGTVWTRQTYSVPCGLFRLRDCTYLVVHDFSVRLDERLGVEGRLPEQHLVHTDAQRPPVALGAVPPVPVLHGLRTDTDILHAAAELCTNGHICRLSEDVTVKRRFWNHASRPDSNQPTEGVQQRNSPSVFQVICSLVSRPPPTTGPAGKEDDDHFREQTNHLTCRSVGFHWCSNTSDVRSIHHLCGFLCVS